MQLNLTTDYSIRILLYLSTVKQATALEMSEQLKISKQYITYMISRNQLIDYVEPIIGVKGGYRLRKRAQSISLLDIIKASEKTILISRCLQDDKQCMTCNTFPNQDCPIKGVFELVQKRLEDHLSGITIQDLKEGG